ncbi:MAG: inositol-phosphate phosphatase [Proteobacteria bacterium]|nr:inositol-phosphate phosphatase [Pseudomonadota bacterium]
MYEQWLQIAREAAAAAAEVIEHYYCREMSIETKADESPVTAADREAERVIHDIIAKACPAHAFFGEETGHSGDASAEFRWLVDPIDGTKSFIRRQPFFSTQIALLHHGEVVVGVSSAAVFGEQAWAVRGGGAFLDGERVNVSDVDTLAAASLSSGNIASLARDSAAWARYGKLLGEVNRIRGYGDFYHYHLLARGALDIVIESDLNILDVAALSLIVEEAGGRFTTLAGGKLNDGTRSVLASNHHLHDTVRGLVQWRE